MKKLLLAILITTLAWGEQDNIITLIPATNSSGVPSSTGQLRFLDLATGATPNYVGFAAPAVVALNTIWTLPAADGTMGQALITDGSASLGWQTLYYQTITVNGMSIGGQAPVLNFINTSSINWACSPPVAGVTTCDAFTIGLTANITRPASGGGTCIDNYANGLLTGSSC